MFGPEENLRVEDTQEQKTRSGLPLPCIIVKCKQKVRNEAIHWQWCDEIHYPTFANLYPYTNSYKASTLWQPQTLYLWEERLDWIIMTSIYSPSSSKWVSLNSLNKWRPILLAVNFVIFSLIQRWDIRDTIWRTEGKNTGLTKWLLWPWVSPKLAWSAGKCDLIGQLTN